MSPEQHGRAAVVGLRQAQSAILHGNLDAECADVRQRLNYFVGDFAIVIYRVGIGLLVQNFPEPLQEGVALIAVLMRLFWEGENLRKIRAAHEQSGDEARTGRGLAGRFGQF